ncbi:MAG TPA: biotin--[acetyl-CoA-carboxylase] ligase [Pseudolysinimonas sp.]|nr:biotin--[acetyl-CoA-carboxylase] ligase [Pseudolysinimonas sp.]
MHLPASQALAPELRVVASSPSTNTELADLARADAMPDFTVLVTDHQTAGRGRLDRTWVTPAGSALAISVLLVPRAGSGPLPVERFGWLTIAAGVAMTQAVSAVLPAASVALKWPNDVLANGRKICGVLAELIPERGAVVIGAGVNLAMTTDELPVTTATSVRIEGGDPDPDTVLAGYLECLRGLVAAYAAADGDAERSGLAGRAGEVCTTLGREVRVDLPGGRILEGTAVALDSDARLVVRALDGIEHAVAAGDVTHARLSG